MTENIHCVIALGEYKLPRRARTMRCASLDDTIVFSSRFNHFAAPSM